jgi:CubicO group peptidase (beta-lactamase class C family)
MPTKKHIDKVLQEADGIIRAHIKKLGPLVGLAVGIVRRGELVYTHNSGFADIKARRPITSDTVFRIMSISKTFTPTR